MIGGCAATFVLRSRRAGSTEAKAQTVGRSAEACWLTRTPGAGADRLGFWEAPYGRDDRGAVEAASSWAARMLSNKRLQLMRRWPCEERAA